MKLTVIGSQGAYPSKDNPSSGYLVEHEGFSLMLDFGSGVLYNLHNYIDIISLGSIIVSHYHPDHVADIGAFHHLIKVQSDLGNYSGRFQIYGPADDSDFERLSYKDYVAAVKAEPGGAVEIGPFLCRFSSNTHPGGGNAVRLECGGKSIVYTGDTGFYEGLAGFASGCSLLLSECSLYKRFEGRVAGHLSSVEAGRIASEAGADALALCHFPHWGNIEELAAEAAEVYDGPIELALPGSWFTL